MSGNKKSSSTTALAIAGAAIGGAIIGLFAGLFGSMASNNDREADLLDLRKRVRVTSKK